MYVNAEKKFSDQLTAGLDVIYAQGTDDTGETQLTQLGDNFNDWTLHDRGPFNADITDFDDMDPAGDSAGVTGGGVYVDFAAMEGLLIQAAVMSHSIPEDGTDGNVVDSVLVYNLGATYDLAPNTTLAAQYNVTNRDDDADTDDVVTMVTRLQIKF